MEEFRKCKCTLNEFINCIGNCEFKTEQRKKILLESKAREMLEMLELLATDNNLDMDTLYDIKKLIKEATNN